MTGPTPQTDTRRAIIAQLREVADQLEREVEADELTRRANRRHLRVIK